VHRAHECLRLARRFRRQDERIALHHVTCSRSC
jgi:hypothetical protein